MAEFQPDDRNFKTSLFKDAVGQIQRLNSVWIRVTHHRENGNLGQARWVLDSAYTELSYDIEKLQKEKKGDFKSDLENLEKDISKAFREKNRAEQYDLLVKKEVILRKCQELAGKGTKWTDEEESFI